MDMENKDFRPTSQRDRGLRTSQEALLAIFQQAKRPDGRYDFLNATPLQHLQSQDRPDLFADGDLDTRQSSL
jgi:hypothetical protein